MRRQGYSPKVIAVKSVVPIPPDLAALPVIEAKPWLKIDSDHDYFLEGPAFDQSNNLFFTSPPIGLICKVTPKKKVITIFENKDIRPIGVAFHRDRRLFAVCHGGQLLVMNPDGSNVKYLYPEYKGKPLCINDLVFDANGYIYVTDFSGSISNPTGGVFRLSPDTRVVDLVLEHLASPNGISLSPEGNVLWIGETTRNTILRIELLEDGITPNPIDGINCAYYSTGAPGGPDSNKVDEKGNLYQCIMFQGRILVLNSYGIPIANVIIPGRDEGKYLRSTNLAFKPSSSEAYITTSGSGGAWIFKFKALARGLKLFSHQ